MDAFCFSGGCVSHLVTDNRREALDSYEYQIKMFTSIFKSALRGMVGEAIHHEIEGDERGRLIDRYVEYVQLIVKRYRELKKIIYVPGFPKRR